MYTARLFSQGVDLSALKFYLDRVVSINHSWRQKTTDTGLLSGEDRILLRSVVLTQYRSDGRTDGLPVEYTALAKLALQHAVKINEKQKRKRV